MNVATLGFDDHLLELIQWVNHSSNHTLVSCFDFPTTAETRHLVKSAVTEESWEALLSKSVADIVLVAARPINAPDHERRNEQLRKLVQADIPLVLVHPGCEMIVGLELEMIRQDSQCLMIPYHAGLFDWRYRQLADMVHVVDDSIGQPLGKVEQLVWERRAMDRGAAAVIKHFARDAMMLRDLMTNVTQVAATGAVEGDGRYANLSVHLTGPSDLIARWSIGPAQQDNGAKLTVIGSTGSAVLEMPEDAAYRLTGAFAPQEPAEAPHPAELLFQQVQRMLAEDNRSGDSPWDASCRTLEIEDAAERSCKRRRTIELFHEKVTERETFKSMMAAGGCAMLMWVLLMLLVAGMVEGLQLPIRESTFWQLWSVILFTPLAIFLLLQLLLSREKPRDE